MSDVSLATANELVANWKEFLNYLSANRDWLRWVDERGITNQVSRDFKTFLYWLEKEKEPRPKEHTAA